MKRSWSPLLKVLLATLGLVAAAAGGGSGLSAQNQKQSAQKPSYVTTQYPVQVQFRDLVGTVDTPGDAVTSDGRIYKDGAEGVSAYMQVTTQSGVVTDSKFVLSIGAVKGKVVRSINLNYTNRVATSCDSNTENNPSGTAPRANGSATPSARPSTAPRQLPLARESGGVPTPNSE